MPSGSGNADFRAGPSQDQKAAAARQRQQLVADLQQQVGAVKNGCSCASSEQSNNSKDGCFCASSENANNSKARTSSAQTQHRASKLGPLVRWTAAVACSVNAVSVVAGRALQGCCNAILKGRDPKLRRSCHSTRTWWIAIMKGPALRCSSGGQARVGLTKDRPFPRFHVAGQMLRCRWLRRKRGTRHAKSRSGWLTRLKSAEPSR